MAIREERDFLSEIERKFLFDSIHNAPHTRADGRELMQQRKIRVQFRRTDEQSQAEIQLGQTRVIANVHGEIVPPFPDRPTEGFLHFGVELSPMASQNFEVGRPSPLAIELARIVDRGIRECRALDTEALAIVAGEKVWAITCTIHVVDHGGNLVDAVSLAAIAALLHYRRPEVSVQGNTTTVYRIDDHAAVPLSLHHIPISISFCFIQGTEADSTTSGGEPIVFMDPTDREERITDGSMTFTFNSFRELCAVHKIGGAAISTTQVLRCAQLAAARVAELTEFLKAEAERADTVDTERRRALLRGRTFADVSSLSSSTTASASQAQQQVDLGAMTDFATLHAPIALREDPSQEEQAAKVSSMAQLLESLEEAAGFAEEEAMPASTSTLTLPSTSEGLALTDEARAEFQKLTMSSSVRELVAGTARGGGGSGGSGGGSTAAGRTAASVGTESKPVHQKPTHDESDSEEESIVVQSEFTGATETPAATKPATTKKVTTTTSAARKTRTTTKTKTKKKKNAVSSEDEDEDEEVDLSAAIKRKPRT